MKAGFKNLLGLCALSLAFHAAPAAAQTAIQPGTVTGTFTALGYIEQIAFTAPVDRNARITDVKVLGINNVSTCLVYLATATGNVWYLVAPGSTTIVPLNSGYGVLAGATVQGYNSTCPATSVWLEMRGFYFTIP